MAIQSSEPTIPAEGNSPTDEYHRAQATLLLTATKVATQCPAAVETVRRLIESFQSGNAPSLPKVRKLIGKIANAMRASPQYEHSALTEYWHTLAFLDEATLHKVISAAVAHLCPAPAAKDNANGPQQT